MASRMLAFSLGSTILPHSASCFRLDRVW